MGLNRNKNYLQAGMAHLVGGGVLVAKAIQNDPNQKINNQRRSMYLINKFKFSDGKNTN